MFQIVNLCCDINSQSSRSGNVNVFSEMIIIMLLFKNITIVVSYINHLTHYFEHIKEAAYHYSAYSF